jgi:hypothetical protein
MHYSHVLKIGAPKFVVHDSISKWAVVATEQCTTWPGGTYEIAGTKSYLGIQYHL